MAPCITWSRDRRVVRLDRLELLERLMAVRAVADRAARGRAEDVLQLRLGRSAVRAAEHGATQLHELRHPCLAWSWRSESCPPELFTPLGCDPVGRPRVVDHDLDVRLAAQLFDRLGHPVTHDL